MVCDTMSFDITTSAEGLSEQMGYCVDATPLGRGTLLSCNVIIKKGWQTPDAFKGTHSTWQRSEALQVLGKSTEG